MRFSLNFNNQFFPSIQIQKFVYFQRFDEFFDWFQDLRDLQKNRVDVTVFYANIASLAQKYAYSGLEKLRLNL